MHLQLISRMRRTLTTQRATCTKPKQLLAECSARTDNLRISSLFFLCVFYFFVLLHSSYCSRRSRLFFAFRIICISGHQSCHNKTKIRCCVDFRYFVYCEFLKYGLFQITIQEMLELD